MIVVESSRVVGLCTTLESPHHENSWRRCFIFNKGWHVATDAAMKKVRKQFNYQQWSEQLWTSSSSSTSSLSSTSPCSLHAVIDVAQQSCIICKHGCVCWQKRLGQFLAHTLWNVPIHLVNFTPDDTWLLAKEISALSEFKLSPHSRHHNGHAHQNATVVTCGECIQAVMFSQCLQYQDMHIVVATVMIINQSQQCQGHWGWCCHAVKRIPRSTLCC